MASVTVTVMMTVGLPCECGGEDALFDVVHWVIGDDGRLPWHGVSSRQAYYERCVCERGEVAALVRGRVTHHTHAMPAEKPAVVVTRYPGRQAHVAGVHHATRLDAALGLQMVRSLGVRDACELVVCGGHRVFNQVLELDLAELVYLTVMPGVWRGDEVVRPLSRAQWRPRPVVEHCDGATRYVLERADEERLRGRCV